MVNSFLVADKTAQAAVAQSVERHIGNVEVTGPIPVSSFLQKIKETPYFTESFVILMEICSGVTFQKRYFSLLFI